MPFTVVQAQLFMASCWLGAIVVSSPLFITQELQQITIYNITFCGVFCGEYHWPQDHKLKLAYGSAILILQYMVPAVIMGFCYYNIVQKVRTDWLTSVNSGGGSLLNEAQQTHSSVRKKRVMYTLLLMVLVFMGSWMPLTIANILKDIGSTAMHYDM